MVQEPHPYLLATRRLKLGHQRPTTLLAVPQELPHLCLGIAMPITASHRRMPTIMVRGMESMHRHTVRTSNKLQQQPHMVLTRDSIILVRMGCTEAHTQRITTLVVLEGTILQPRIRWPEDNR